MRTITRRIAAAFAAPALGLTALVATAAPASAATDTGPTMSAGYWLGAQLQDGLVLSPYQDEDGNPYVDHGLTIDTALALHKVGAPASVIKGVSDALEARIDDYVAPGYGTNVSAGSAAKALVLVEAAAGDPTSYGGRNLVADLQGTVVPDGAAAGRIQDDLDMSNEYATDYANVFGQAFAAEALDSQSSAQAGSVTGYLLGQQCEAGYFRKDLSAVDDAAQTCDASEGLPSVDATALAIQSLQSQRDDADVSAAVDSAAQWLLSIQKADGSFESDDEIAVSNANSTGAAAYALLLAGKDEAAARAASWLRAHQATNIANCVYYDSADTGAVLYDDAALATAQGSAMDDQLRYETVRATAQALPGLLAAPTGSGDPHALFTAEYVKAGGKKAVGVIGAAPGEALCAMLGEQSVLGYADANGEADLSVLIPRKTATSTVEVANAAGVIDTVEINALGAAKPKVKLKHKVKRGHKQVVRVRGLAAGEQVRIRFAGKSVASGQAKANGTYRAAFKATRKPGKAKVTVLGQFKNRKASKTFVIRR